MQQPSFNPQGQPSPYSAPPPKKSGPSFLTCCLGCLGLGVLAIVIMAGLTYMKMNRAAGAPITAATYRSEFPADFPLHPNLKFDEKTTGAMRLANGAMGLVPKANGATMRIMAFHCPGGLSAIMPWYRQQLPPRGYSVSTGGSVPGQPQHGEAYSFGKGSTWVMMTQGNQRNAPAAGPQADIVIVMVGRNMPGRPGSMPGAPPPMPGAPR